MADSQKSLSILISGAGIAGASLALFLARQPGFKLRPDITLLERSPRPRTTGQAIDIRGPAVKIIKQLGLEPSIKALHTTEIGTAWINSKGEKVGVFGMSGDSAAQGPTSEYEILRGDLAALLTEELDKDESKRTGATVNIVYGDSIKSLTGEAPNIKVEFTKGKLPDRSYNVVIAADGMSSTTRALMFPDQYTADASAACLRPWGMYIAFFTVPRAEQDEDYWLWYNAAPGLTTHIRPHRDRKNMGVYLSITLPKRERDPTLDGIIASGDVGAQRALLRERFKDVGWEIERLLAGMDAADDFYMQSVAQVITPKWTAKGGCAIVGDSAFSQMGMGTSLAMMGAYTIAGELARVEDSADGEQIAEALDRYEKVLRPFVEKCQWAPPGVPQLMNPQTQWGISVMHTIIKLVTWSGVAKMLGGLAGSGEDKVQFPDYGW